MNMKTSAVKFIADSAVSGSKSLFTGQGFLQSLTDAAVYLPKTYGRILSDSFVGSVQKAFSNQNNAKVLKNLFVPIVGGTIVNGAAIGYSTLNMFEDKRRIWNLGGLRSEFQTDPKAANNTWRLSAAATAMGLIPFFGGASELAGSAMENSAKTSGFGKFLSGPLKLFGKGIKHANNLVYKAGWGIGKGVDLAIKGFGNITGQKFNTNVAGITGKHYLWIQLLIAARMLYKYLAIDSQKKKAGGVGNMAIGGQVIGYDNDINSPTYLIAHGFKDRLENRLIAQQQGQLMGSNLGKNVQGAYQTAMNYLT